MPTKRKSVSKAKQGPIRNAALKGKPAIENTMLNEGSHYRSDGSLDAGKGEPSREIAEDIVHTVKDGVLSVLESVGDFVQKVSPAASRPRKLKTKPPIIPPFTPPI